MGVLSVNECVREDISSPSCGKRLATESRVGTGKDKNSRWANSMSMATTPGSASSTPMLARMSETSRESRGSGFCCDMAEKLCYPRRSVRRWDGDG
jgi:hypothetical protein